MASGLNTASIYIWRLILTVFMDPPTYLNEKQRTRFNVMGEN
jgi:hypothetical protein